MIRKRKLAKALGSAIAGAELGTKSPEPAAKAPVVWEHADYAYVREERHALEEAARYAFEHHQEIEAHQFSEAVEATLEARRRGEVPDFGKDRG